MKKNTKVLDPANTAEQENKSLTTETATNKADAVENSTSIEQECPISYQVFLSERKLGGEKKQTRKSGHRESRLFTDPNPLLARQEAVIFATGLSLLAENEHRWVTSVFDTPSESKFKRYLNYNQWSIEIRLINNQNGDTFLIYDSAGDPSYDTLKALDTEFYLLDSLGCTDRKYFVVDGGDGKWYKCINSKIGLVKFEEPHSSDSPVEAIT